MKKIIALVLSLIMMFSVCMPAGAIFDCGSEENLRLVVPENWEMNIGDSRTVEAVFTGEVTNRVLSWSTKPSSVASVDQWGRVTAVKAGTATVTARTSDGLVSSVVLKVTEQATKTQKSNKDKHDYEGAAIDENDVLQKIVTRYAKTNSADVPDFVKAEDTYLNAKTAETADGAVWKITSYGVLRTDKNASNSRDVEQRFMGDR